MGWIDQVLHLCCCCCFNPVTCVCPVSEVKCECKLGYVGDGSTCTGNLLQVLRATPTFSNFLTVSLEQCLSVFT